MEGDTHPTSRPPGYHDVLIALVKAQHEWRRVAELSWLCSDAGPDIADHAEGQAELVEAAV